MNAPRLAEMCMTTCRKIVNSLQRFIVSSGLHQKKIIYNDAATIVYWTDGTKTVVKCNENDEYSEYAGFIAAVAKKMYGGANAINRLIDSKKVIRGNGLGQPFRSEKTFVEIFDEAAKKCEKLPPDPLEHPELHSR